MAEPELISTYVIQPHGTAADHPGEHAPAAGRAPISGSLTASDAARCF